MAAEPVPVCDVEAVGAASGLRLNQMQVIGTHNSYHLEPYPAMHGLQKSELMQKLWPDAANVADEYSHRPLHEQLDQQRIRQIELDLYADPNGGAYQNPFGLQLARLRGVELPDDGRDAVMAKPGIKIMHRPDFDYRATVFTFKAALQEVRA
jgi:hypothetical protein